MRKLIAVAMLAVASLASAADGRLDRIDHDAQGRIIRAVGVDASGKPLIVEFWYQADQACTPGIPCSLPPPGPYATRDITAAGVGPWIRTQDGKPDPTLPTGPLL